MANGDNACPEHPDPTRRRGFRYCFHVKHHGRGERDASQWAEDLSRDEEFSIFDEAEQHDLSDLKGDFYGVRRSADGEVLDLGTKGEQIAKFWDPITNQPAHGFPLWPLAATGPTNRRKKPAPKEALLKMELAGLLQPIQRKRLQKGDRL